MLLSKPVVVEGAPSSAGGRLWRFDGKTRLTVWVRATIGFDADGRAGGFVDVDAPLSDEETALRAPTAGVVLVGHAHASDDRPASEVVARLLVSRANISLVDKIISAVGDASPGGGRAPFTKMPLTWEKAVGGRLVPENPVGASYAANLIDPRNPARPVCFAPVGRSWPERQRLFGERDRGGIEPERRDPSAAGRYSEPPEVPPDFDFGFFQCAPLDQRATRWVGDEIITLQSMNANRPRLDLELPSAVAEVRVADRWGPGEWGPAPCQLYCVAADDLRVTCVFRSDHELAANVSPRELAVRARVAASFGARTTLLGEETTMVAGAAPPVVAAARRVSLAPPSSSRGDPEPSSRSKSGTLPSPKPRR